MNTMASKSRRLLIFSSAALLLLIALAGIGALAVFERLRAGESELRRRFFERSRWLDEARSGIYLSGTLVRDYFAEPDGPDGPMLVSGLAQLEVLTHRALDNYARYENREKTTASALAGEVAAYWRVIHLMADMARKTKTPELEAYFRRQLGQRRQTMMEIANQIAAAQDREMRRREAELAALYTRLRIALGLGLALAVAAGAALAVAAGRRLLRLESETRALSAEVVRAQEQERRSIARELHDEIGQALSGLLLEVGGAAADERSGPVRSRLETVAAMAETAVDRLRAVALKLRPSMLDDLGLVPALEWQARETGQQTGLEVEVDAEESAGELPEAYRTCIYRVVQEALRNCARHSGARRVRVVLERQPNSVSLRVEDDGRGFSPARTRGMGLLGMEERVAQLGGRFRIQSEAGRGTAVLAELPL